MNIIPGSCKACNAPGLKRFLELGLVPPVNAFLYPHEVPFEKKYPLNLAYCPECLLVQLEDVVPPEELFSNYLHLSSGAPSNVTHLKSVAEFLHASFNFNPHTKVLEIGSNDGTLLSFIQQYTPHVLGIDPAQNLVALNKEKGVEMIPAFFNTRTASAILEKKGAYNLIVALNVIPHTPDVVDLLKGVHTLLAPHGSLIMEGAYALETILQGQFDTVYHEHVYCFSLHSLISTFRLAGLEVVDVQQLPTQGSSLRITAQRKKEAQPISPAVHALLKREKDEGLINPSTYDAVGLRVSQFKNQFRQIVDAQKRKGGKLIGIGAPARGVVILNYCGLGPQDIDYIIDDTPLKQGKLTPGVHIPVTSWDALKGANKTNFLLLSWNLNFRENLMNRIKQHSPQSDVLIPFPLLEVFQHG